MILSLQASLKQQFALLLLATLVVLAIKQTVCADTDGANADFSGGSPKRQYLIAPRIGRSPTIWSALEEAALTSPGQLQPNRGFPGPLRSSLFFLVGNRRLGPRSGGLLPQARIGRRAAPMGLMPQPRVGRRADQQMSSSIVNADETEGIEFNGAGSGSGQQEVAVATLSDTSPFSEALESFVSALAGSSETSFAYDRSSREATIEKPAHRATSFVPRLGKRELDMDKVSLEKLLCLNYGLDCRRLALEMNQRDAPLVSLLTSLLRAQLDSGKKSLGGEDYSQHPDEPQSLELLDLIGQQLKRETRASEESNLTLGQLLGSSASMSDLRGGGKRVAFTPRIGR